MRTRKEIASTLADEWPVYDVVLTCNDCDSKIFSLEDTAAISPGALASHLVESVDQHQHKYREHLDMKVDIYPEKPVKEIDMEITVK